MSVHSPTTRLSSRVPRAARLALAGAAVVAVNVAFTACTDGSSDTASDVDAVASAPEVASSEPEADASAETAPEPDTAAAAGAEPEPESTPESEPEPDPKPEDDDEPAPTTVAGEPLDYGPTAGTSLVVVGVAHDDVLNFRIVPDPSAEIVTTVAPLAEADIAAAGDAWQAPTGVWWKVTVNGLEAWANQAFLGGAGDEDDIFDQVQADLDSLEFDSLEAAAAAVAATRASTDPVSSIVEATEPVALDAVGGYLVVDVIGLGDDSVKGERLRVEVEFRFEGEGDDRSLVAVTLTGVDATPICGRGVSGGLCV